MTRADVLQRYPRLVAHVIAHSLGYATPSLAARIVSDAHAGRQNWCEWVLSCYRGDSRGVIRDAIRGRHRHQGFMASYPRALNLVREAAMTGAEPSFASWF